MYINLIQNHTILHKNLKQKKITIKHKFYPQQIEQKRSVILKIILMFYLIQNNSIIDINYHLTGFWLLTIKWSLIFLKTLHPKNPL